MYKIKQIPEDFIVREINELQFDKSGEYAYYLLKKTNYNTVDAIKKICDAWKIGEKYVNFAGTKDKIAVTEQYISISKGPKKDLSLKDIELKYLGNGKERLNLGSLKGNYFEITIRNIEKLPDEKEVFVNYFDEQRFGKNKDNHIVGKHILKGRYKEACSLIEETKPYLELKPNDYIGALRSIPKKTLKMYVHAYQSHLWNEVANEMSKKTKENMKIPLIGFDTEFNDDETTQIYERIMKEENITLRDFINRSIPELSESGAMRELYIKPQNIKIEELEEDELNLGRKKVLIKFFILPGGYATNVVKTLMGRV